MRFSHSGLDFDTILASIGSETVYFTVHNKSSQNIVIQQVILKKGELSPFLININGQSQQADNVRLAKYDSMFIFVGVRKNERLLLSDSVQFIINGKAQYFPLRAYVRDGIIFGDTVFSQGVHFTNAQPYLFLGNATIADAVTATVDAGSELLFDYKKRLQVNGTLQANGSKERPVLFAGVRYRNPWYGTYSGQWEGIAFGSNSANNRIAWAKIQGTTTGIYVEDTLHTNNNTQLTLSHSELLYTKKHLCVKGGRVVVDSSMFSNELKNETIILLDADSTVCL
ncbi:hypothetical protein FACS189467_8450 [Bacteroidia bacterium]|nr:hypothetical protein FACS189467_8450 [Bacteroidia bacterium]